MIKQLGLNMVLLSCNCKEDIGYYIFFFFFFIIGRKPLGQRHAMTSVHFDESRLETKLNVTSEKFEHQDMNVMSYDHGRIQAHVWDESSP
jgi:hypothetical protein